MTPGSARGPRCPCSPRSTELHLSSGAPAGLRSPLSRNSCFSGYRGLCSVVCLLLLSMCTLSSVEFLALICTKCCPFEVHSRSSTYVGTSLVPVEMVRDPPQSGVSWSKSSTLFDQVCGEAASCFLRMGLKLLKLS